MSIRARISLKEILLSFENVLRIEYKDKDVEQIIKRAKQAIENSYQVQLGDDIFETQSANSRIYGETLDNFLAQLTECIKGMSLIMALTLFDKRKDMTLKDVNYLGFSSPQLRTALQYLQDETLYEKRNTFMTVLVRQTSNVEMSEIKRILVIMLTLEKLGVKEGVAILAQYLYLGVC